MLHRALITVSCAALALVGLAACGGDDSDSGSDSDSTAITTPVFPEIDITDLRGQAAPAVSAIDNLFEPAGIHVDPGATVTWTNEGRVAHNILDAGPEGASSDFQVMTNAFNPGDTFSYTFDEPGVYRYYCTLHGSRTDGMIGVVQVGDAEITDTEATQTEDGSNEANVLRVPDDYGTIQEAVDAATPGSLVLIAPGTYNEAVTVSNPDIVIRGEDRNTTILDGEFSEEPGRENGFKVLADGVAIENITAQNFVTNGFFWTGVTGYRGSYLTAIRNGDYGIYAFDSVKGQFDHSYASGSPDAGFYIGQCEPCDAVITDSVAEWNGLGYSGTNSGGNLLIVNSEFRNNRAGIVPNSGTGEKLWPGHDTVVVGNSVHDNNNDQTSAISIAELAIGNGILLAGVNDNIVERNLVYNHDLTGIAVIPLPEKIINPDNADAINFNAEGNRIVGNVVRDSGAADLGLVSTLDDPDTTGGNCFADNEAETGLPAGDLDEMAPCDVTPVPAFTTDLAKFVELLGAEKPGSEDYKVVELPDPGTLPNMPDALMAPPRPASSGVPMAIDLAAIETPGA